MFLTAPCVFDQHRVLTLAFLDFMDNFNDQLNQIDGRRCRGATRLQLAIGVGQSTAMAGGATGLNVGEGLQMAKQ